MRGKGVFENVGGKKKNRKGRINTEGPKKKTFVRSEPVERLLPEGTFKQIKTSNHSERDRLVTRSVEEACGGLARKTQKIKNPQKHYGGAEKRTVYGNKGGAHAAAHETGKEKEETERRGNPSERVWGRGECRIKKKRRKKREGGPHLPPKKGSASDGQKKRIEERQRES